MNRYCLDHLRRQTCIAVLVFFLVSVPSFAHAAEVSHAPASATHTLWIDPGDIGSKDLYYGPGGKKSLPQPPVDFLKEDKGGTNPKFDARDSAGTKWKVKLGIESRPEVAASRLLWAMGYFTNVNYYVADLQVNGLKLKRGKQFEESGNEVQAARLQRHPDEEKKVGDWSWRHNPFKKTREFDGLRVMMALISNWDLKDDNNAIYEDKKNPEERRYEVSDVGTAFGTSGKTYTSDLSKSNLGAYQHHKLVAKVHTSYVDLNFPTHPSIIHVFEFPFEWRAFRNRWIGRHIAREHVKWIASLLAQLKPTQIRDAFRAAGYPPVQVEEYAQAVEARIAELEKI